MCGIGGCVMEPGETPPIDRLQALRHALGHRGPDDWGIECLDNVGLVQTRLSIVDLSAAGHQPTEHPGGRFWLVYNGEVYNHLALRGELDAGGLVGHGDTETVLWLLERFGLNAVPSFNGQFAFAALDLERRCLLLCRDRFGIKPLYVARFADGIWFASEPAALVRAGASTHAISRAFRAILDGSSFGGEQTLVDGITRLGPGTWALIPLDGDPVTFGRWYVPADAVDPELGAQLQRRSRRELARTLESTLRAAVHAALLSDVRVGALLSGGVDSSLITALAAEVRPDLVAFGASYAGHRTYREAAAARRVAARLGVELDLMEVTPESWRRGFVAATVHFGSPLTNASVVTVAQLAKRARDGGVKVLLTGEGADELFGSYDTLHADALQDVLPRHHRLVRRAERTMIGDPTPPSAWATLSTPPGGPDLIGEALFAYGGHPVERCRVEARLLAHFDLSLAWLLNRIDANLMQSSVEGRVPFLDPDLVRLVLNLPLEARIGPWSKGILRDVARSMLPFSIAYRPKIPGMDFDAGAWIEEAADPAFLAQGLLRDALAIPEAEFESAITASNGRMRMRIWSAEVWCRSLLARHSTEQIERALWR